MSVRSPNNIGRAVQTDPTLLRYASAITEQKKCSELPAQTFDRFQTPNKTQQHATGCANGSNIVALRFGDHGTKELLGVVGWKVWPVSNFALQHQTTCNRVCKRTQHVTSNNVGSCWPTIMRPFARVLKLTWLDISTPLLVFFTLVEMFCTKKRTSQYFKKSINKG